VTLVDLWTCGLVDLWKRNRGGSEQQHPDRRRRVEPPELI
jgi:hypothetical protein